MQHQKTFLFRLKHNAAILLKKNSDSFVIQNVFKHLMFDNFGFLRGKQEGGGNKNVKLLILNIK